MRLSAYRQLVWKNKAFCNKLSLTSLSVNTYLQSTSRRLAPVSDTPALDAQVLLARILRRPRTWVLAHPEGQLSQQEAQDLEASTGRLEGGEPLPYVLGHWEFYGLDFVVNPAVLIPRPETEHLVEKALSWLGTHSGPRLALDVGTGSGCIALTLAVYDPALRVIAADVSSAALQVAQVNARRLEVERRVALVQADLIPAVDRRFDLILANLPYIPLATLRALPVARWEPSLALDGGPDGLDIVRRLLQSAPGYLAVGGLLLLEIEASQGEVVATLAQAAFPLAKVGILPDLAGHDRLVVIE